MAHVSPVCGRLGTGTWAMPTLRINKTRVATSLKQIVVISSVLPAAAAMFFAANRGALAVHHSHVRGLVCGVSN